MKNLNVLLIVAVVAIVSGSTNYVLADVFTDVTVNGPMTIDGVVTMRSDLFLDRTAAFNNIVQSQAAFDLDRDVVYQKAGGGDMSGYQVRADKIILSGGNVGINTASPTQALDVFGNAKISGSISVDGITVLRNDLFLDRTAANNNIVQSGAAFAAGKHIVYQKAGGGDMSGYFVRADLIGLSGGNVGIGTESPTEALDVLGNIRLTGDIVSPTDICIGTCP